MGHAQTARGDFRSGDRSAGATIGRSKLSSIRTLSAKSPVLMALAAILPAVSFPSIIGQKIAGPAHIGTDGVVAYASSHLDAVIEIKRILRAHLGTL